MASLVLLDVEDFLPFIEDDYELETTNDKEFLLKQYNIFCGVTSGNDPLQYESYDKLSKFQEQINNHNTTETRMNFLYNLMFHRWQYDLQSIRSQNVFNNFYFNPQENQLVKQFFIGAIQIAFTMALFDELLSDINDIFENMQVEYLIFSIAITFLTTLFIEPQVTSIKHDLSTISLYFKPVKINFALNVISNLFVALCIPIVTFLVILTSESITDVVLNATAIAFIVELDDQATREIEYEQWLVSQTRYFETFFRLNCPEKHEIFDNPTNKELIRVWANIRRNLADENRFDKYITFGSILWDIFSFLVAPMNLFLQPFYLVYYYCYQSQQDYDNDNDESIKKNDISIANTSSKRKSTKEDYVQMEQTIALTEYDAEYDSKEEEYKEEYKDNICVNNFINVFKHWTDEFAEGKEEAQQTGSKGSCINFNEKANEFVYEGKEENGLNAYDEAIKSYRNDSKVTALINYNKANALILLGIKNRAQQFPNQHIGKGRISNTNFTNAKNTLEIINVMNADVDVDVDVDVDNDNDNSDPFSSLVYLKLGDVCFELSLFSDSLNYYTKSKQLNDEIDLDADKMDFLHYDIKQIPKVDSLDNIISMININQEKLLRFIKYNYFTFEFEYFEKVRQMFVDKNNYDGFISAINMCDEIKNRQFISNVYKAKFNCLSSDLRYLLNENRNNKASIDIKKCYNVNRDYIYSLFRIHSNNQTFAEKTISLYTKKILNSISNNKKDPYYYFIRGRAYTKLKLYKFATSDFNEAIQIDEKNPLFYSALGIVQFYFGQVKEALVTWKSAHNMKDNKNSELYNHFACCATYVLNTNIDTEINYKNISSGWNWKGDRQNNEWKKSGSRILSADKPPEHFIRDRNVFFYRDIPAYYEIIISFWERYHNLVKYHDNNENYSETIKLFNHIINPRFHTKPAIEYIQNANNKNNLLHFISPATGENTLLFAIRNYYIAEMTDLEFIVFLLKYQCNIDNNYVNEQNLFDQNTALHIATSYGALEIILFLKLFNVKTDLTNIYGKTAVNIAMDKKNIEVARFINNDIENNIRLQQMTNAIQAVQDDNDNEQYIYQNSKYMRVLLESYMDVEYGWLNLDLPVDDSDTKEEKEEKEPQFAFINNCPSNIFRRYPDDLPKIICNLIPDTKEAYDWYLSLTIKGKKDITSCIIAKKDSPIYSQQYGLDNLKLENKRKYWMSKEQNGWIIFDCGEQKISDIVVGCYANSGGSPTSFSLETSDTYNDDESDDDDDDDEKNTENKWQFVYEKTSYTSGLIIQVNGLNKRYIKLNLLDGTRSNLEISSINFYTCDMDMKKDEILNLPVKYTNYILCQTILGYGHPSESPKIEQASNTFKSLLKNIKYPFATRLICELDNNINGKIMCDKKIEINDPSNARILVRGYQVGLKDGLVKKYCSLTQNLYIKQSVKFEGHKWNDAENKDEGITYIRGNIVRNNGTLSASELGYYGSNGLGYGGENDEASGSYGNVFSDHPDNGKMYGDKKLSKLYRGCGKINSSTASGGILIIECNEFINNGLVLCQGGNKTSGGSLFILCKKFRNLRKGIIRCDGEHNYHYDRKTNGRMAIYCDEILMNQGIIKPEPYYGSYQEGKKILDSRNFDV